jgi:hypothetical protein
MVGKPSRPVACHQEENQKVKHGVGGWEKNSEALFGATLRKMVEVGSER